MGRTRTIDNDSLLRTAEGLFRERGHTISTREIARATGISEAVLYQRFGSKDDLFFAAMTPATTDVEALLGAVHTIRTVDDARRYVDAVALRIADLLGRMMPTLLQVLAYPATDHSKVVQWHRALPFEPLIAGLTTRFAALTAAGHLTSQDSALGPGSVGTLIDVLWAGIGTSADGTSNIGET